MALKLNPDALSYIPLGGVGEVGGNCYLYGHQNQFVMLDCGLNFPDDSYPGIDILLPDIHFAEHNKDQLLGLVITHGHEDHIGAIPYLWERLQCPIYATGFTYELVKHKMKEGGIPLKYLHQFESHKPLELGQMTLEFVEMAHSIPDAYGVVLKAGDVKAFHTGDWKIDPTPLVGHKTDERRLKSLDIDVLIGDSTNGLRTTSSGSEATAKEGLMAAIQGAKGAVAVTCFSSNVARVDSLLKAAEATGRDVCLVGRSLIKNVQAAIECGHLATKVNFIPEKESSHLPKERILYICTGCQGEPRAALSRIAHESHRDVHFTAGDTVVFSSMEIPGNEVAIQKLYASFSLKGVNVITRQTHPDVHVSGHASAEELRLLYQWTAPKLAIPMHGEGHMLAAHAQIAEEEGVQETILTQNGSVVEITPDRLKLIGKLESVPHGIDETGEVDLEGLSLRERKRMNYAGAAVLTLLQDPGSNTFIPPVTLTILGLLDSQAERNELIEEVIEDVRQKLGRLKPKQLKEREMIKEQAALQVRKSVKRLTGKKPVIDVQLIQVV